jgi:hypothetical protein
VILAIEPLGMPTLERSLKREGKEIPVCPGLNADSADHLAVGGTQLIFEEEIIFEKRETRKDGEVNLADMDENRNPKNGVGIQMDKFDLEMVKETTEEVTAGEPESLL